jgi:hypothetical protein
VAALDTSNAAGQERTWAELRPLGAAVVPHLAQAFPRFRKWQGRACLVFHCIRHARASDAAFDLAVRALADKSHVVRYRACGLLAYSLRRDALPHLEPLLLHADRRTAEDAAAAVDAIRRGNHDFFVDRTHTGRAHWVVE